jgi:competence protein ComEA
MSFFRMPIRHKPASRIRPDFSFSWIAMTSLLVTGLASPVRADLPDGPGKATVVRVCGKCHSPEQAVSLHQERDDWEDTVTKMVKLGAKGSDEEFEAVLNYLATYFGPEAGGSVNVNTASTVDLESGLRLGRSEAEAIVQYRTEKGKFQSIEDLRNVPGLDFKKIEANKSRLAF